MALSRTAACHSCRRWILQSFIATFAQSQSQPLPARAQRTPFSTAPRRWNQPRSHIQQVDAEAFPLNAINENSVNPIQEEEDIIPSEVRDEREYTGQQLLDEQAAETATDHIPWYLQQSSPLESTAPAALSARQRIPDLPANPPPLLAPLLHQISVDLGIDDLTLLDLRSLDPPPALGANLLMLIGTARSEKHLHVSADKLCRWLRSEHFLSPFADGLLGRQELKLKLRRKAKRNKLMSAVGGKGGGDAEDLAEGIRTGWVCVNVGEVEAVAGEGVESNEEVLEREGTFVGFGPGQKTGCRIVVQMLTEEKRGEVDLERLWTAVLKKSEREKEAIAKQEVIEDENIIGEEVPEPAVVAAPTESDALGEIPPTTDDAEDHSRTTIRGIRGRQQLRAYHTSARQFQASFKTSPIDTETTSLPPLIQQEETFSATSFLRTWHSFPALSLPRSTAQYTILFNALAAGHFNNASLPPDDSPIMLYSAQDSFEAELQGIQATEAEEAGLTNVRGHAAARRVLWEALSGMAREEPAVAVEGEGGVELAMGILKAVRYLDPEGVEGRFSGWRVRCERLLRGMLEEGGRSV